MDPRAWSAGGTNETTGRALFSSASSSGGSHFRLGVCRSLRVDGRRRDAIDFICTSDQPNEAASNLSSNKKWPLCFSSSSSFNSPLDKDNQSKQPFLPLLSTYQSIRQSIYPSFHPNYHTTLNLMCLIVKTIDVAVFHWRHQVYQWTNMLF